MSIGFLPAAFTMMAPHVTAAKTIRTPVFGVHHIPFEVTEGCLHLSSTRQQTGGDGQIQAKYCLFFLLVTQLGRCYISRFLKEQLYLLR